MSQPNNARGTLAWVKAGKWLRSLRQAQVLSVSDVARQIESSDTFVRRLELGQDRFPRYLWPRIACIYAIEDRRTFAKSLTRFYDPILYNLLLGVRGRRGSPNKASRSKRRITPEERLRRVTAGQWLTKQISAAGVSKEQVAQRLGFDVAYINEIDRGENRIALEHYADFAKLLRIEPRTFAIQMTCFYDPEVYDMMFGTVPVSEAVRGKSP